MNEHNRITYIEETNINTNLDNLKKSISSTNCITFNNLIYLEEIFKSYRNNDKIQEQFNLDCNRTNIEVNNIKINNITEFEENIGWLKHISISNDMVKNIYEYMMMLTLQSSYCFPYMVLHKLYCENVKNYVVSNLPTNRNIYINTATDYLQIIIECDLEIKDYYNNNTINKINSTLYIKFKYDMNKINCLDNIDNISDVIDKHGLLVWKHIND